MHEQATGALRHVVVTWNTENYATRMRLKSWKTNGAQGGGALGNLVSHCFYYLEDFCGPITGVSARLFGMPNETEETESTVALSGQFKTGVGLSLLVSAASYLGSGHRIEFYGEDGTLVLANPTADYLRGFEVHFARRPAASLEFIAADPADAYPDGRIAPVARLAGRFLDAIENGTVTNPDIHAGYRVQQLIDGARRSHANGTWIEVAPERIAAEASA
jgi:predicted dehydrogenase